MRSFSNLNEPDRYREIVGSFLDRVEAAAS
jgi:hypothetical protein